MSSEPLRPTALMSMDECPARWAHEREHGRIEKDRDDEAAYAAWGTFVHEGVERAVQHGHKGFRPDAPEWLDFWRHGAPKRMPSREVQSAEQYATELWFRVHGPGPSLRPVAVEQRFTRRVALGLPAITGQPDLIAWDLAARRWLIIDHKTNRRAEPAEVWRRRFQQRCYAWWWRAHQLDLEKKTRVVQPTAGAPVDFEIGYALLGERVRWETDPWDDADWEREFADLCAELAVYERRNEWPERVNAWCRSCPRLPTCAAVTNATTNLQAVCGEPTPSEVVTRYAEASEARRLAEARLEALKEDVRQYIAAEGGAVTAGDFQLALQGRSKRTVAARHLVPLLTLEEAADIFTVNLAALDWWLEEGRPAVAAELRAQVETLIEREAQSPALTVRRRPA